MTALVAAVILAYGCSSAGGGSQPFDPADQSAEDSGGLPTKDDGGLGTKDDDAGLGTKDDDGGLGTKDDGGLGSEDGGMVVADAGQAEDAGSGAADAGTASPPDAGGEMSECFVCAERRGCRAQVNACVRSSACVDEGKCDLACVTSAGRPFGVVNQLCVEACDTDWHATHDLLAAVTCGFRVCPVECLRPLISCGGDAGAGPTDPSEPGCLMGHAAMPH
jgi:hypothetical protein